MIALVDIVLTLLSLVLLVPALILLVETLLALAYQPKDSHPKSRRPNIAVLMPAHDEATGIRQSVESLLLQLLPTDRLLVVADNCSDDTASLAASAGAEVIERQDPTQRGKGFALDFGVRHLRNNPPEIVVIADADCEFSPGSIDLLARDCQRLGRPIQALYLMLAPEGTGAKTRVAQFAWTMKNQVRPLGLLVLAQPCQLMGTGMAFTWPCICSAPLATGHIVEDMQLGLELTRQGMPACFCPEARVTSYFPRTEEGIRTQRTRWEHGHLGMIITEAPRLLVSSLRKRNVPGAVLAIDLLVPPLTLFVLLLIVNAAIDIAFGISSGDRTPLQIALIDSAFTAIAIFVSWMRFGRQILTPRMLASAPAYMARKLPIYLRFLLARQLSWVRSKRDP